MGRRTTSTIAAFVAAVVAMWGLGPMSLVANTSEGDERRAAVTFDGHYELRYRSTTELMPGTGGGESWGGHFEIDGEIAWQPYDPAKHGVVIPEPAGDGATRHVVSLPVCERLELTVLGNRLLGADDCAMVSADWAAVVELDRRGHLVKVWEPADTPETTSYVIAHLASELQLTWPGSDARVGATWRGREEDSVGVADSIYTLGRADRGAWLVTRTRDRYHTIDATVGLAGEWTQRVDAGAEISIGAGGRVTRMSGAQTVNVDNEIGARYAIFESAVDLTRIGEASSVARAVAGAYRPVRHKHARDAASMRNRLLADRVAGLTREQLLSDLAVYANSGTMPDHNRWLWRATGLLELDPELAEVLIEPFMGAGSRGRALILDLLVNADTDEAEATLRALLVSDELSADPRHVALRQRLGFVRDPSPETVQFAFDQLSVFEADDHSDVALITAYSAGAVAGRGDSALSDAIHADLIGRLGGADDPETVTHLLRAIANVGDPNDTEMFAGLATHADPSVRMAVADAVGQTRTDRGRELLRELVADSSTPVQMQSLLSLREYEPNGGDFAALDAVVSTGGLHATNERLVLQLAVRFGDREPEASRRLVASLVSAGIEDSRLLALANRFMARTASE